MSATSSTSRKQSIRLLKFCANATFRIVEDNTAGCGKLKLQRAGTAIAVFDKNVFKSLVAEGLVHQRDQDWTITRVGKSHLRRLLSQVVEFASQHRILAKVEISENGQKADGVDGSCTIGVKCAILQLS